MNVWWAGTGEYSAEKAKEVKDTAAEKASNIANAAKETIASNYEAAKQKLGRQRRDPEL